MEVCFIPIGLFVFASTIVGAVRIVVFLARTFTGDSRQAPPNTRRDRTRCPRCGTFFSAVHRACPSCDLPPDGPIARELRDLEATARTIDRLRDQSAIAPEVINPLFSAMEARQQELITGRPTVEPFDDLKVLTPAHAPVPEVVAAPPALPAEPTPAPVELAEPVPPPLPPLPRRSMGEVFGEFMKERNILWGELLGGLLIVGCSIALVISLWRTLEDRIHYFPFLVIGGLTVAMFAVGRYTLSHWKLESTSRGVLVIATLLTPLSFLVLAGLSARRSAGAVDLLTEAGAILVFGYFVRSAMQTLCGSGLGDPRAGTWLALAIIGSSASQLLVTRWLNGADSPSTLFAMIGLAPPVAQAIALAPILVGQRRRESIEPPAAHALLVAVGATIFTVAVALGFLIYWCDDSGRTISELAVPVALAGWPLFFTGLLVFRRLRAPTSDESAAMDGGSTRMFGAAFGLAGVALILAALGLAWPRPGPLMLSGLGNALLLVSAATVLRFSPAYYPGIVCLLVGGLTAYHQVTGRLPIDPPLAGRELLTRFLAGDGALGLSLCAAALALFSDQLLAWCRRADAVIFAVAAAVVAGAACVTTISEPGAGRSAAVYALAGLGAIAANMRWRLAPVNLVGCLLTLGALFFLIRFRLPGLEWGRQWLLASLAHATLFIPAGLVLRRRDEDSWRRGVALPLLDGGLIASFLALTLLVFQLDGESLPASAGQCLGLAALWLITSLVMRWSPLMGCVQATTALAATLFAAHSLRDQPWLAGDFRRLLSPIGIQAILVAAAFVLAGWSAIRWAARSWQRLHALLNPPWLAVDRILALTVTAHAVILVVVATAHACRHDGSLGVGAFPNFLLDLRAAWLLTALLLAAHLPALASPTTAGAVSAAVSLLCCIPFLLALRHSESFVVATAARWWAAAGFLVLSVGLWMRSVVRPWLDRHVPAVWERWDSAPVVRFIVYLLTLAPTLALSWDAAEHWLNHRAPITDPLWQQLRPAGSLAMPLGLAILTLAGHALRERSALTALGGGLVLVAGAYTIRLVEAYQSGPIDSSGFIAAWHWGLLAAGLWAIGWLPVRTWREHRVSGVFSATSLAGVLLLAVVAVLGVLPQLNRVIPPWVADVGNALGIAAWATIGFSSIALATRGSARAGVHAVALTGLAGASIVSSRLLATDATGWHSYHALTLGCTLTGAIVLAASWIGSGVRAIGPGTWPDEKRVALAGWFGRVFPPVASRRWIDVICCAVAALAIGGTWSDPERPYWSAMAVLAVGLLFAATAIWARRPGYVGLSGLSLNLVAYLVWQGQIVDSLQWREWWPVGPGVSDRLILYQVIALAVGSGTWSLVELTLRRREPPIDLRRRGVPYVYLAGWLAAHVLAAVVITSAIALAMARPLELDRALVALAVGITALAVAITAWDPEAGGYAMPGPALYLIGLLCALRLAEWAGGVALAHVSWVMLALAIYVAMVSLLHRLAPALRPIGRGLSIPAVAESRWSDWPWAALSATGAVIVALSVWVVLHRSTVEGRLTGPMAVGILAVAAWTFDSRRSAVRVLALTLLTGVLSSWAFIDAKPPDAWLVRSARLFCVSSLFAIFVASHVGRRMAGPGGVMLVRWASGLTAVALLATLFFEFLSYDNDLRTTPLPRGDMLLVVALLLAAIVAAVAVAVRTRNPLGLSLRGRTGCVWAAETLVVLLLLHLRLNVPDLFPSYLGRYWPLTIMAVCFLGAGLGEISRRRGLPMLAGPLHQTGIFLPVLPIAAYMLRPLLNLGSLAETAPGVQALQRYLDRLAGHHFMVPASVWFLLGTLYMLVAITRRTAGFAIVGALAANFGLWVIYAQHDSLALTLHPQLWLIPIGIIILGAERLNRDRLTDTQASACRYLGLAVIYVSSAADLFITGLGNSVWLPIISAGLAVAGALAGILLRVRAFLALGVAFLGLVIFSQIWHAAVDRQQTWIWWVSGIVLGVAILGMFAVFEKRRDEMEKLLAELKQWK